MIQNNNIVVYDGRATAHILMLYLLLCYNYIYKQNLKMYVQYNNYRK